MRLLFPILLAAAIAALLMPAHESVSNLIIDVPSFLGNASCKPAQAIQQEWPAQAARHWFRTTALAQRAPVDHCPQAACSVEECMTAYTVEVVP